MGGRKCRLMDSEASPSTVPEEAVVMLGGQLQKNTRSSSAGSHKPCRKLQETQSTYGCPGGNAGPVFEQRPAMECCSPRTKLFCLCQDGFPRWTSLFSQNPQG